VEIAVQKIAVACFLVIGLSHIVQPRAWVKFFHLLHSKGEAGCFIVGFLSLTFGALIVGFHNVWASVPVVLTVVGWGQLIKATRYFLFPQASLRTLTWVREETAWMFVAGGEICIAIAALLLYGLYIV